MERKEPPREGDPRGLLPLGLAGSTAYIERLRELWATVHGQRREQSLLYADPGRYGGGDGR